VIAPVRSAITLRDYQEDTLREVSQAWREGHRRCVAIQPTGAGKTVTAAEGTRRTESRGRTALWMVHRTELVGQAISTLESFGLTVGAIAASAGIERPYAPVQVCMIQTLLAREHRPKADLIVWDEVHHCSEASAEWSSLLDAYPDAYVLGLTATPERGDGAGLAPLFTKLVQSVSVRDLTTTGQLVACEVIRPHKRLAPKELAQEPLAAYLEHSPGQQGFLFARNVEEAQRYAAQFTGAGILAACVHAKTPAAERAMAVEMFRQGRIRILSNVYCFTEGTDLPMASVCILARGAATTGIFLQMTGRVLRPWPGKTSATLIDLPGVSHVHGMPEDERVWSLEGKACRRAGMHCQVCSKPIEMYPCPFCQYNPETSDGGDQDETTITNDRLVKYARKIAEGPEQRWETLVRWLRIARTKGHKLYSVHHKWVHVYGEPPPREWFLRACALVESL